MVHSETERADYSCVICVADINITKQIDQCLSDLALPDIHIQRAKQLSLVDRNALLGLRSGFRLDESRAIIYRIYVPTVYEDGLMRRIISAGDLKMGGRGSVFSQHIGFRRGSPLPFDTETLERLCGKSETIAPENHALIACIVPRGSGTALAQAVLQLGICVPVIFFGTGVGLRDKLGLLRITIPVEKEIIWCAVPRYDAELVEKTLISRARLDVPGQGFLYKSFISAPLVNLRVRQGKRIHAATMEQVINALDEVHGSSDWRRFGSRKNEVQGSGNKDLGTKALFFIGDEEEVETFRRIAMDNGARGASLYPLETRSGGKLAQEQAMESHSRLLCDIIISNALEEKLQEPLAQTGLFESGRTCMLKTFEVEMPAAISYFRPYTGRN